MTLFLLLSLFAFSEFEKPPLAVKEARLCVHLPGSIFTDDEVKRRLFSGLTTSVILETEVRGNGATSTHTCVLELRYDLWEEQLGMRYVCEGGVSEVRLFKNIEELVAYLEKDALELAGLSANVSGSLTVRTRLRVIPFSRVEEEDTANWLGDVLKTPSGSTQQQDRGRQRTTAEQSGGNEIFQLLMTTGIKRDSVLDLRWKWRLNGVGGR